MKNTRTALILVGLLAISASSFAASPAGSPMAKDEVKKDMPAAAAVDMADGEVRKIDKVNKKVTLKHGAIKNLDMPGMTMVFQVKDAALLDKLAQMTPGDKIMFTAEQQQGAFVVTGAEKAAAK